ncbi:MAG: C4-dicarboxylate ABC transporter permease [Rhodospirillaceae bacterium]|nr:C4-dicarboxylate ABC transporter permease [Rhodospirillaceae bacterium]|tara:strand:- start:822 stop:1409 length:588 start_codon:yes stop_codon:yes gene_type:complete
MEVLIRTSDVLNRIVRFTGKLFAWLSVPMIILILFDVITRRFLVLGSTKLQEMEWHLHAALFLMCLGFGYLQNSHVRIELLRERFSPRLKAWIELLGCGIFLLSFCVLMIYFGVNFAHRSYVMGEVSSALTGLSHRWIIKSFIPLGIFFLLLAGVSVACRNIVYLFGPERLRKEAEAHAPELHNPEEELAQVRLK